MFMLFSCSQKQSTHFLQLEMYGEHEAALYIVSNDGGISFSGGRDALVGETTWNSTLSESQFKELKRLKAQLWYSELATQSQHRFVLSTDEITAMNISRSNETTGELYAFLEEMTSNRFDSFLESLPKPTTSIIIDRSIEGDRYQDSIDVTATQSDQ